ncbi:DNA-directed RNA polymerase subunit omega [Acidobacteria bacterium ACD]|nr:MAG: DNA-directed RNA polymerase subunit omega [Acidobacteriota bacterium]MCE7960489.1 DNA-directed RNA polymerase subunit omega [Acidobacteria bacterium ACB2]MDL1952212.1 DNA-directed RNA polymerase subunit omega [Acidobacteria bacterium ACD]
MTDLPPNIESKFRLVHIAARRAEQLIQGARPKLESRHVKPTRVALDEVGADLVRWQIGGAPATEEAPLPEDPLPTAGD